MTEQQQLGGSRKGEPLDDENYYPITLFEYLTIKENLLLDKFTNLESVLASTFITTFIACIIFLFTGSFTNTELIDNIEQKSVNLSHVVIIIIYGAVSLGALFGLIASKLSKKKGKNTIERLDDKITKHLTKTDNE